jgi:hypothetical protein
LPKNTIKPFLTTQIVETLEIHSQMGDKREGRTKQFLLDRRS